jgi:hypothetical protein
MTEAKSQLEVAIDLLRDVVTKRVQSAEELAMQALKLAAANRDAINRMTDAVTVAVLEMTAIARRIDAVVANFEAHMSEHLKTCPPKNGETP